MNTYTEPVTNFFSDAWHTCQDTFNNQIVPGYHKTVDTAKDKYNTIYVRNVEQFIDDICGEKHPTLTVTLKKIAKVAPLALALVAASLILPPVLSTILNLGLSITLIVSIFKNRDLAVNLFNIQGICHTVETVGMIAYAAFSSNPAGYFVGGIISGAMAGLDFWMAHQFSTNQA